MVDAPGLWEARRWPQMGMRMLREADADDDHRRSSPSFDGGDGPPLDFISAHDWQFFFWDREPSWALTTPTTATLFLDPPHIWVLFWIPPTTGNGHFPPEIHKWEHF